MGLKTQKFGGNLFSVAQSFAFVVFATLICQINSVFPCKDTKALFGCAEFLDSLLLVVAQSFAFAVFATLICQINSVFPCKDTKRYSACAEFLDSLLLVVAQSFVLASKNSFFCKCHEPTLQNPAQAEFWDKTPYICGTELCFCRLCNFDLPNKQRFSLQRHKSVIRLCQILG